MGSAPPHNLPIFDTKASIEHHLPAKGKPILERDIVRSQGNVIELKWYTTAQVAEMLGYGLTKTKHLVLSGQIRSIKDGGNRRILPEWVDEYVRHKVKDDTG